MIPEAGVDGKLQYVAEGEWDFFGGSDFVMVAEVRFEPSSPYSIRYRFMTAAA